MPHEFKRQFWHIAHRKSARSANGGPYKRGTWGLDEGNAAMMNHGPTGLQSYDPCVGTAAHGGPSPEGPVGAAIGRPPLVHRPSSPVSRVHQAQTAAYEVAGGSTCQGFGSATDRRVGHIRGGLSPNIGPSAFLPRFFALKEPGRRRHVTPVQNPRKKKASAPQQHAARSLRSPLTPAPPAPPATGPPRRPTASASRPGERG